MKNTFLVLCVSFVLFFSCDIFFSDVTGYFSANSGEAVHTGVDEKPKDTVTLLGVTHNLNEDNTYTVVDFDANYTDGIVNIPEKVNGITVTKIGIEAFQGNTNITGVFLPDTILAVDQRAFDGCTNITQISLGEGVEELGSHAFNDCDALQTLIIPSSVLSVHANCFVSSANLTVYVESSETQANFIEGWRNGVGVCYNLDYNWFKITFETNGGSNVTPIPVISSASIDSLPVPTRMGKTFDGWYTDLNYHTNVSAINNISESTTLYAKWR